VIFVLSVLGAGAARHERTDSAFQYSPPHAQTSSTAR
jgi:hypothetical protein